MSLNIKETEKLRDAMTTVSSVASHLQSMVDNRSDQPRSSQEIEDHGSMMEMIRVLKKTHRDLHKIWSEKGKFSG